jgi:hypothetical protein
MIKAPFGIVWTLVGAAAPFSTLSLTRPPAWTHGASRFRALRGAATAPRCCSEPARGPAPRGSADQPAAGRAQPRSAHTGVPCYPGCCAATRTARSGAERRAGSHPRPVGHVGRRSAGQCGASEECHVTPIPRPQIRLARACRLTQFIKSTGLQYTSCCGLQSAQSAHSGAVTCGRGDARRARNAGAARVARRAAGGAQDFERRSFTPRVRKGRPSSTAA